VKTVVVVVVVVVCVREGAFGKGWRGIEGTFPAIGNFCGIFSPLRFGPQCLRCLWGLLLCRLAVSGMGRLGVLVM